MLEEEYSNMQKRKTQGRNITKSRVSAGRWNANDSLSLNSISSLPNRFDPSKTSLCNFVPHVSGIFLRKFVWSSGSFCLGLLPVHYCHCHDGWQMAQLVLIILCSLNGLWVSFREQLTHWQSALVLKIRGFIRFIVNLEKITLYDYPQYSPNVSYLKLNSSYL